MSNEKAKEAGAGAFKKMDVVRPKWTVTNYVVSSIIGFFGVITFLSGLILGPFGIPAMIVAVMLLVVAANRLIEINCPTCESKQHVFITSEKKRIKCKTCKEPILYTDITEDVPEEDRPLSIMADAFESKEKHGK